MSAVVLKDTLKDIIQYTYHLGGIEHIKIVGQDNQTKISALTDDKTVIINGVLKTAVADFAGIFGMPNLGKVKTILSFEEYGEDAKISVLRESRDDVEFPTGIHFENAAGDFTNDYRFMSRELVEELVKNVTFKGAEWQIEFEPQVNSIQRLKRQCLANSDQTKFTTKMSGSSLQISFGNVSTHAGKFTFHDGLSGKLTKELSWPVKQFLAIMDLPGAKIVQVADKGVMRITVDSGIADYEYLIPASK